MLTVFIYNNIYNRLERYSLERYEDMPYSSGRITVSDFFSDSRSLIGWTSSDFLRRVSKLCTEKGAPCRFFRRIFEGGHISQSMHYAGLAADFSHELHFSEFSYGYPELSLGSLGLFVFVLQDALSALGFLKSELDGFFGHETRAALSGFQQACGLLTTGVAEKETFSRLAFSACGSGFSENTQHTKNCNMIFCSF